MISNPLGPRLCPAALLTAALVATPALAQPFSFTRIANFSTPVPSGVGNFNALYQPSVSAGRVAFRGDSVGHNNDPYDWTGVYTDLPGPLTAIASGSSYSGYAYVVDPSIDASTVAYKSSVPFNQVLSTWTGGVSTFVADKGTNAPPGGSGPFDALARPSVHAGKVAFWGFASPPSLTGIFTNATGPLTNTIRDGTTPIPGGAGAFTGVTDPDFDGGHFAFFGMGSSSQQGVYLTTPAGSVSRIADRTTPVPGGSGTFFLLSTLPSFDGTDAAFQAYGTAGEKGVYRTLGGGLSMVADHSTPIPGGAGLFTGFANEPAIDGAYVAFIGEGSSGQHGLFVGTASGGIFDIIGAGDPLDGRIVQRLDIGREAIDGQTLGFWAEFTDGTEGVYITTIPSPGAATLLGAAALACIRRRRST
jgi:hypothetical protein